MEKPKLDLSELEVTSFATGSTTLPGIDTIIISPADPTAATHCYVCPVRTNDCY
ncbi:hypothetical protein [Longimicrobium sp.]|uniref:hypothetical protein n=1 Tax=Longimicrobium sp. TaxID=2029185 RepID=UPI002E36D7F8|nr:hypothetical protein [Longimicrobium sp.]HEX6040185.1 hypothetical protein [Longimicrobium sp.]